MGFDHVVSIIFFLILSISIPYLAKKYLNEKQQHILAKKYSTGYETGGCKMNRSRNRLDLILFHLLLSAHIHNMRCNIEPIETYTSIILTYGGSLLEVVYVY